MCQLIFAPRCLGLCLVLGGVDEFAELFDGRFRRRQIERPRDHDLVRGQLLFDFGVGSGLRIELLQGVGFAGDNPIWNSPGGMSTNFMPALLTNSSGSPR